MATLLICSYLPAQLVPDDLSSTRMTELYRLVGMARRARRMKQEDIAAGIALAFNED